LPSAATARLGPLQSALARKARTGGAGANVGTVVAAGDGWRAVDVVCTAGPADRPYEERQASASISLVLAGAFVYRSARGASFLSPGALLLGGAGDVFECSHDHGEGDRCLSFQFDAPLFERLAHDAGASRPAFAADRLPPVRDLAAVTARAVAALAGRDAFEEVALDLAGTVVRLAGRDVRPAPPRLPDPTRVARVLRELEAHAAEPQSLATMARTAGLGRHHFLRAFKAVTGVTPHQWVLRARLRDAAVRLRSTRAPVTEIALDVGFDDLSNFIRTFRAEFGVSPRHYRRGG